MLLAVLRLVHSERSSSPDEPAGRGASRARASGRIDAAALLERLAAGEPAAARTLVEHGRPVVARALVNIAGRRDDLDDLVQETFARVFVRIHEIDEPDALFGFLRAVAVNVAREALRARRRRPWWRLSLEREPLDAPGPDPTPGTDALLSLERAMKTLDVDERIAFSLRYLEGLGNADVAEAMGVSVGTVKRRLRSAEAHVVAEVGDELGLSGEER